MHVLHCTRHAGSIFHYANSANITLCVGLVSYCVGLHCIFFSNDSNNNLYAAPSSFTNVRCTIDAFPAYMIESGHTLICVPLNCY